MVTQLVLESWVYSLFDHLTLLLAGESVTEKRFFVCMFVCLFVSFFLSFSFFLFFFLSGLIVKHNFILIVWRQYEFCF
jgi:hypothetical protein